MMEDSSLSNINKEIAEPGPQNVYSTQPEKHNSEASSVKLIQSRERKSHLHDQTKQVIYNVIQFFEVEKHNCGLMYPVDKVLARAAAATGYCMRTISRIKKEGRAAASAGQLIVTPKRKKRAKRINVSQHQLATLKQFVLNHYAAQKQYPSLENILRVAKAEIGLQCSKEYLRKLLAEKLELNPRSCHKMLNNKKKVEPVT